MHMCAKAALQLHTSLYKTAIQQAVQVEGNSF